MIDGGRCIGREEMYVYDFAQYAKSLGCTVEWFDYKNRYTLNGYTFVSDIQGPDYHSPDYFAAAIYLTGKIIAKIEYDGQDRMEQYASIFDRERFHIRFYDYVKPFTMIEKIHYKFTHLFSKKEAFFYHQPCNYGEYIIPKYYNINKTQQNNYPGIRNFIDDEQIKEKIKYLVTENTRLLKEFKTQDKLNDIEEDFK